MSEKSVFRGREFFVKRVHKKAFRSTKGKVPHRVKTEKRGIESLRAKAIAGKKNNAALKKCLSLNLSHRRGEGPI